MLPDDYNMQSVWKIAEIAVMCVKPQGIQRPTISGVLKEIQEAIAIERVSGLHGECPGKVLSKKTMGSSVISDMIGSATPEQNVSLPELFVQPGLR